MVFSPLRMANGGVPRGKADMVMEEHEVDSFDGQMEGKKGANEHKRHGGRDKIRGSGGLYPKDGHVSTITQ